MLPIHSILQDIWDKATADLPTPPPHYEASVRICLFCLTPIAKPGHFTQHAKECPKYEGPPPETIREYLGQEWLFREWSRLSETWGCSPLEYFSMNGNSAYQAGQTHEAAD